MKKLLFFSILVSLLTISCKKEGCTEPNATNYDPKAEENDGSCVYNNNGGGSGTCTSTLELDNFDQYDYTIISGATGNSFNVDAYGDLSLTVTNSSCVTFSVYDGNYFEGSFNFCPCNGNGSYDIDFY
ncbi:MAG: hypothetical protein R2799_09365 [Crocinitomicaceae bacterium]